MAKIIQKAVRKPKQQHVGVDVKALYMALGKTWI
jgi:hypothetical protein